MVKRLSIKSTLKALYEMKQIYRNRYKETDIIIGTPVGNTDNIQVKEAVKQSTIFGAIMYCAENPQLTALEKK